MPKINLYIFNILKKVSSIASGSRQEAYLVGGYIRDFLSGRITNDIDIAVTGDSLSISRQIADSVGAKYFVLDQENRVSRLELSHRNTGYQIDFSAIESDIVHDLGRRDFTINAMAVDLKGLDHSLSRITDPYKGRTDIERKLIRAINDDIFRHDPSRLLRAVRLAATLDFKVSKTTEHLIKYNRQLAKDIAGEHIRTELIKLIRIPGTYYWIKYLDRLGLLAIIIPEIEVLKNVQQPKEHHWDVFHHSLETIATTELLLRESDWRYNTGNLLVGALWSRDISSHFNKNISIDCNRKQLLKIAAFLHDIAKPATKQIDNTGRMRFLGHSKLGSQIVEEILSRLRFSNKEIEIVSTLVYNHLRPAQLSNSGLPSQRAIYRFFRDTKNNGIDIIFLALADYLASKGPKIKTREWKAHNYLMKYVIKEHLKQQDKFADIRLINGYDLMNIFGLKPGPLIGELLTDIEEAQASGELSSKEEAINYIRGKLKGKRIIGNN